ncbi:MAG: MBOAT family O-acyltransferase [Pirellulales bacterium]
MGHPALSFLLCVAAAHTIAIAIYPALRRGGVSAVLTVVPGAIAIIACLFIIPPEFRIHRGIAALFCVDLFFRLIDFTRQNLSGELQPIRWSHYCRFLIPFPFLLVVFGRKDRSLRPDQRSGTDLFRVALGSIGVTLGLVLVFTAERSYTLQSSFAFDHVAKLFIFVLTVESLAQTLCGVERLAGFDTTPIIDRGFLARTPAEFWRRYNNRVQPWLYWNVFVPAGGRRAPIRGVWVTFLVSAIFHELAFAFATSRFTGYQFTFFLIQVPAVIASPALDRLVLGWPVLGSTIARTATILWIGATSIFFFHGVDLIFPFVYTSEPWLP